ncbi:hypothetical protein MD484_g8562, partial [Candolleomyces efflorescens]
MAEDSDMNDPSNPPNSRSTTPVPPPPQHARERQAQEPAASAYAGPYPNAQPVASYPGYYPSQPQVYTSQQPAGLYPLHSQGVQPPQGSYPYAPLYSQHPPPNPVHQHGYFHQPYPFGVPAHHYPAYPPNPTPVADSSETHSSRESSVAPSSEGESVNSTTSTATQRPEPTSRKKRRYDPGDGEPSNHLGSTSNQPLNTGHNIPHAALFQEIQNQFRQFQGQLDSIAHSVTAEPKELAVPIASQEDVLKQLLKGYQETTDILRILAEAQVKATSGPADRDCGAEGQDNNMEVDVKDPLQSIKVREQPKERSVESVTLARIVREFFQKRAPSRIFDSTSEFPPVARGTIVAISPSPTTIANLFVSNFRCRRSRYQLALKKAKNADMAAVEVEVDRQKRRRRERKRWLYYRRIRAAKCFEETRRHLPMIGRPPVSGLPSDFYHPGWLSKQSDFVKKNLRIGEESKYDFTHDPHINDLAMGNHGQLNVIWGYA